MTNSEEPKQELPFDLNVLKLKENVSIPEGSNDYGMSLKILGEKSDP